jgi:hypothetical protein
VYNGSTSLVATAHVLNFTLLKDHIMASTKIESDRWHYNKSPQIMCLIEPTDPIRVTVAISNVLLL